MRFLAASNATSAQLAAEAAQAIASAAAGQAAASALVAAQTVAAAVQTIGVTGTPITGNNIAANTYVLAPPAIGSGYISTIRLFSASAGTFQVRIFSKSGDVFTQVGSDHPVTVALGLNVLTSANFGSIPVAKDHFVGFYATAVGRIKYLPVTISDRHYFVATGNQTSFTDTSVNIVNDIQIGFDISYAGVDDDRVASIEARLAPLLGNSTAQQIIGAPGVPALANSSVGGTYVFHDPVTTEGVIRNISLYSATNTTVPVYVWRATGEDFAMVTSRTLTVTTGLNELSAPGDFAEIPVKAGQYVGMFSDGSINYYSSGEPYSGGYHRIDALITYMTTPPLVSGSGARLQISFVISQFNEAVPLPASSDGATLSRLRAKLATKLYASAGIIRIGIIGDSWTERSAIPAALKSFLTTAYGTSGYGWISCDALNPLTGLTHTQSGWTVFDASVPDDGVPPVGVGCSMDGKACYATGTSATASIAVACTSFKIGYRDTAGTFRWRVDGGAWTSVVGGNTGAKSWVSITGLSDASHTIEIDLTGNAGTVVLYGYVARRTAAGVEFHKLGNGSIDASQIAGYLDQMPPFWTELSLDLIICILGTNDYRRGKAFSIYTSSLSSIVNGVRAVNADAGAILWAPADSNGTVVTPLADYAAEMYRLSGEEVLDCEFFNHNKLFGLWADMNALGLWDDTLHMNDTGAYAACKELVRRFFWL